MSDTLIKQRFETLSPEYQEFLESGYVTELADLVTTTGKLNEEQNVLLINATVLYLLFFLDLDGFVNFMAREADLDKQEAEKVVGAILSGLPDGIAVVQNEGYTLFTNPPTETTGESVQSTQSGVRTMADDINQINSEQTYSSTQAAILKEGEQSKPSDEPRWGKV